MSSGRGRAKKQENAAFAATLCRADTTLAVCFLSIGPQGQRRMGSQSNTCATLTCAQAAQPPRPPGGRRNRTKPPGHYLHRDQQKASLDRQRLSLTDQLRLFTFDQRLVPDNCGLQIGNCHQRGQATVQAWPAAQGSTRRPTPHRRLTDMCPSPPREDHGVCPIGQPREEAQGLGRERVAEARVPQQEAAGEGGEEPGGDQPDDGEEGEEGEEEDAGDHEVVHHEGVVEALEAVGHLIHEHLHFQA